MRISCVHQGYELYGSDRSFAESVAAIRNAFPQATIEVVLPRAGPLATLLAGVADAVTVEPVWVLRRQAIVRLATTGLAALPGAIVRAARRMRGADLVYVNTSVVADYALAARFVPGKMLMHVHEIPEGPTRVALRGLALWSRAEIIFNSQATQAAFALPRRVPTHVIYNGVAGPPAPEPCRYDGLRPLRVLMLGRINRIKGQEVLLDALSLLPRPVRQRIAVRIVGGAFQSDERERVLAEAIEAQGLAAEVSLEPFVTDPAPLYRWADIVVVPSRRPESLGRVAIEAMAYGRPPLASAIGGLREVVDDGVTGWLVPPGDALALSGRLRAIVEDHAAWRSFAAAGRARYEALFSEAGAAGAIAAVVGARLRQPAARQPAETRGDAIAEVR